MNIDTMLETVIDNLNDGLVVSEEVRDDPKKGYPYMYGYMKSTAQISVDQLKTIVEQYRSLMLENNQ
tara:strand:- start:232 stop:432 length:201 start_codon:yes stop_codon:yes gene_type:complete